MFFFSMDKTDDSLTKFFDNKAILAIFYHLIKIFIYFGVCIPIMALLFIIDSANLMISVGISPAQSAWFKKTYNENPDLCTFSIDDAVNEELSSLLLDIQSKYKGLIN